MTVISDQKVRRRYKLKDIYHSFTVNRALSSYFMHVYEPPGAVHAP